jgi:2-polyprenyl-3-methyl-5-hydroxy-6-metoxy-1,4-benzoquinol methylase
VGREQGPFSAAKLLRTEQRCFDFQIRYAIEFCQFFPTKNVELLRVGRFAQTFDPTLMITTKYIAEQVANRAELAERPWTVRILVAIANYGTANDKYLATVLEQYRAMPYRVDIVILSNLAKHFGSDVQLRVGLPIRNPRSLPFGHKALFAEQVENYDLFIYSEDDSFVTQRNIDAFLQMTPILSEDEIVGFLRFEVDPQGRRHFCDANTHWHWDPGSIKSRGDYTFAFFTNEHAGFYVLTQQQLKRAIASGGFMVGPHRGKYGLLETAATDPYTQCGLKKLICISRLEDFLIRHLSNKYVGSLSLEEMEFRTQINALLEIQKAQRPRVGLLGPKVVGVASKWAKSYYETFCPELASLIPTNTRTLLSVGCGWGRFESVLMKKGISVTGIPIDSVIAACAEANGVETVCGDFVAVQQQLAHRKFDCIVIRQLLHLIADPVDILNSMKSFLAPGGVLIASIPNFTQLPTLWKRLRHFVRNNEQEEMSIHMATHRVVRRWLETSELNLVRIMRLVPKRAQFASWLSHGLSDRLLASQIIFVAKE